MEVLHRHSTDRVPDPRGVVLFREVDRASAILFLLVGNPDSRAFFDGDDHPADVADRDGKDLRTRHWRGTALNGFVSEWHGS